MNNRLLGSYGEEHAKEYLLAKGYKILERNFRNKLGEIDLIVKDGSMVCFIEVKTRISLHYGAPFESVNSTKQLKIVQVALSYLKLKYHTTDVLSRFDVVSIYRNPKGKPIIEHIVNAFDLTYLSH
ncbi:MAG: YraN family protein [Candidatus Omnitrophota bacterium]